MSSILSTLFLKQDYSLALELTRAGQQAPGTCPFLPYQAWDDTQVGTLSWPAFNVGLLIYAARLEWPNHFPAPSSNAFRTKFVIAYTLNSGGSAHQHLTHDGLKFAGCMK